jgi:hypothetical protein
MNVKKSIIETWFSFSIVVQRVSKLVTKKINIECILLWTYHICAENYGSRTDFLQLAPHSQTPPPHVLA